MFEILGFIVLAGLAIFLLVLLAILIWSIVEYGRKDK